MKEDQHNLIDSKRVRLFDALEELSNLQSKIKVPQIIVVGDQSSGKSSTLEALVRFSFPVDEKFCTRFPTRLILRRSCQNKTSVSIQPAPERCSKQRQKILGAFNGTTPNLDNCVRQATEILGLSAGEPDQGITNGPSAHKESKPNAAHDVLLVEKEGPDLGHFSLTDLPGLIQAETQEQDACTLQIIKSMINEYLQLPRTIILLVVNAQTSFANSHIVKLIQDHKKTDPALAKRVIGVVTHPDGSGAIREDVVNLLNGRLDSSEFQYPWHVVCNQQKHRRVDGLDTRDQFERDYLFKEDVSKWPEMIRNVSPAQKGIDALRQSLKNALRALTQEELPSLIVEVQHQLHDVSEMLEDVGPSRPEPEDQSNYLLDIAMALDRVTEAACRGSYESGAACIKARNDNHVKADCRICLFFRPFGDDGTEGQTRRLRANTRLLNQRFAKVMREHGKTEIIADSSNVSTGGQNDGSASQAEDDCHRILPNWKDLQGNYQRGSRKSHPRDMYEKELGAKLLGWRGPEPPGEVNSGVYGAFFEYQSMNWERLAIGHHEAVWKVTWAFMDEVLLTVCPNDRILQALRDKIVKPELESIKDASSKTLQSLLACRGGGKTGFYDSFVDVFRQQKQSTEQLFQELDNLSNSAATARDNGQGKTLTQDQNGRFMQELARAVTRAAVKGFVLPNNLPANLGLETLITNKLDSVIESILSIQPKKESSTSQGPGSCQMAPIEAIRTIDHVETFYSTVLESFIGFVNALVVERGILDRLPGAILGRVKVLVRDHSDESKSNINEIAGESEEATEQREQNITRRNKLQKVLNTLKEYHRP